MKKDFLIYFTFIIMFSIVPLTVKAEQKACKYEGDSWRFVFVVSEDGKVLKKRYFVNNGIIGNGTWSLIDTEESNLISVSDINSSNCPKVACIDGATFSIGHCPLDIISGIEVNASSQTIITDNPFLIGYTGDIGSLVFDESTSFLATGNCNPDSGVFGLFKITYNLLKLASPIILIIFGTIDMAKAVVSSDEGKMKKAQNSFIRRMVAAIIVFLSFIIVEFIVKLVDGSEVMDCVSKLF